VRIVDHERALLLPAIGFANSFDPQGGELAFRNHLHSRIGLRERVIASGRPIDLTQSAQGGTA